MVYSLKTPFFQCALDALSVSMGQTGSGQVGEEKGEEKGETEAGEAGCAGILWMHEFWKSELLLFQKKVPSWSTRIVRASYKREAWDVLGDVLRKSAPPPRFSSLCTNKNGLNKHYPA